LNFQLYFNLKGKKGYEEIINKFINLEIEHKKEIFKVIERQAVEWSDLLTLIDNSVEFMSTKARTMVGQDRKQNQVRPNSKYTNKRGSPLAVRDVVTILSTAGVATKGDLARIDFFSG